MWYNSHNLHLEYLDYESLSPWRKHSGGGSPGCWGITGFGIQQQLQSTSHLGPVAAWLYRQCFMCSYTSLGCSRVTTSCLAKCLRPWRLTGREIVGLMPRAFKTRREGRSQLGTPGPSRLVRREKGGADIWQSHLQIMAAYSTKWH